MANKNVPDTQWSNGFLHGLLWAAGNPQIGQDIEPRPFPDERARDWIAANAADIARMYVSEVQAELHEAKEPGPPKDLTPAEYRHKRGMVGHPPAKAKGAGK